MSMEASYQDRRIRDLEREVKDMQRRLATAECEMREMRGTIDRLTRSKRPHTPHLDRMILGPDR